MNVVVTFQERAHAGSLKWVLIHEQERDVAAGTGATVIHVVKVSPMAFDLSRTSMREAFHLRGHSIVPEMSVVCRELLPPRARVSTGCRHRERKLQLAP
jgi:hypothetical protein